MTPPDDTDDVSPPDSTWPPTEPADPALARAAQQRAVRLMLGVMSGFTCAGLSIGYGCTGHPVAWWGLLPAVILAWAGVRAARPARPG